jgi:capsular polysaccharide biosynthesis protein
MPEKHVETPETTQMTFEAFSRDLSAPIYTAPAVYTTTLSGARYCSTTHCVLDERGALITESTGPGGRPLSFPPWTFDRPVRRISGLATSFRCCFNDFYHLLVDNLSRLDLLNFDPFRDYPSISLMCPELTPLERFFVEKLLPENVTIVETPPGYLYEPDQFLFNTFITSKASGYLRGPFVNRLRTRLGLASPNRPRTERILVSRAQAPKGRRILNEDDLFDALRPFGFERYILEDLPITEQIDLFHRAEAVVAPHGAGLSHLLFSPHTAVLELFASPIVIPHYYLLSKSLGHDYHFLTGSRAHHDENFRVVVSDVEARVSDMLSPSRSIPESSSG